MKCFNFAVELAVLASNNMILRIKSVWGTRYHLGAGKEIILFMFYINAIFWYIQFACELEVCV